MYPKMMAHLPWLLITLLLSVFTRVISYGTLSDQTLRDLPRPGNDFNIKNGQILSPILVPRVPGTPGSTAVLNHFAQFFSQALPEWDVSYQNSTSKTPTSKGAEIPFKNFIASRDPPWAKPGDTSRLTLVAHYDSKMEPEGFIGAVDSAAPCAMIMHAVRSIDRALTKKWKSMQAQGDTGDLDDEHKGIQVIFLDGEEAFLSWSNTDSIYGARSLAEEWDNSPHPAMSTHKTKLESISLFVLLDLLGAKDPSIPTYFKTTHWAYQNMAKLESRLRSLNQFKSSSSGRLWLPESSKDPHTSGSFPSYVMQDDHIPFMARGVEVLHLIPIHFPEVWHRIEDDGEHLDPPTVEDWATLTTAFAAEWLELEGYFDPHQNRVKGRSEDNISKTEL